MDDQFFYTYCNKIKIKVPKCFVEFNNNLGIVRMSIQTVSNNCREQGVAEYNMVGLVDHNYKTLLQLGIENKTIDIFDDGNILLGVRYYRPQNNTIPSSVNISHELNAYYHYKLINGKLKYIECIEYDGFQILEDKSLLFYLEDFPESTLVYDLKIDKSQINEGKLMQ